ncbi:nucleotidyltransferase family protein [Paragemmobacter ruber]|uniref:NTP transferase domain-containing protein n=1 Tax=Paragemmobacter ruber TaxID=1985673 RepID=A0ABW9Y707_9RHOB|nr:nucleotidyltransferase family protein [Rhodobacter ruber]NBE08338.1 NTP transferase domain-containing protein [Rhodobacter ruber]
MQVHILVLAAGSSSRMRGGDKLLEPVAGRPLIAHVAAAALATGLPVHVTLPADRPARSAALQGLGIRSVTLPEPPAGMAESLKAGLAAIPQDAGVMVLLADMPDITPNDLITLRDAWQAEPEAILRGAAADGTAGHPVCFPPDLRDDLMMLQGDEGARSVLVRHRARLRLIPLPDCHATTDLDTPEAWAAWRGARVDSAEPDPAEGA